MIKNKKILIAGGNGFIGTNLCLKLKKNNKILIIDNYSTSCNKDKFWLKHNIPIIYWDITKPLSLCKMYLFLNNFDIIINLACPASPKLYQKDPIHTMDTCYLGTKNLLTLMNKNTIFLQASTSEIYGNSFNNIQSEKDRGNVNCFGPRACYDEGKRIAETLCYEKIKQGYNVKIIRIFNTYGPWMNLLDGRVIPNVINQIINNESITIYGDGNQTRSFQYIDDLLNGIELVLLSDINVPINIGNPEEITINELVQTLLLLTNSESPIIHKELPQDDPTHRKPDITLISSLGFFPKVSLKKGLIKTLLFFDYV